MVDMTCEGCVNAVKNKLETIEGSNRRLLSFVLFGYDLLCCCFIICNGKFWSLNKGIENVEVDLPNQVVRILGSSPVKAMTQALEQTGRKARLIGQGVPQG